MDQLPRVYGASRASNPEFAEWWRHLRSTGANLVSTWIDVQNGSPIDYEVLWSNITKEIQSCDRLVLYIKPDDFPLKGALIEAGMALALGKPVYIVAPDVVVDSNTFGPIGSWINHPLVQFTDNIIDAVFGKV
jgi:hypothetical protein